MKFWQTIPFVMATLVIQAQTPPTQMMPSAATATASVPLYRVTVVQNSAKAINYGTLKGSNKIDFQGTVLASKASGVAKVKSGQDGTRITAKFKDLPAPSSFGGEYLTYVLWGISTEGRATNLGEILINKNGKGELKTTDALQTFGLVVTAEPYFAVSQPSDVVVVENAPRKGTQDQVETIDAKYSLLKRGQYTLNLDSSAPIVMDEKTPFDVYQARNAVRIARASGAQAYAASAFEKADTNLKMAESDKAPKKSRIMAARESVQSAEDARLISIQRQAAEQTALDQRLAQNQLNEANAAQAAALQQAAQSSAGEANALNQVRRSEADNDALRAELLAQFNAVLQTRLTARGLIVNMSGMLFQTGKAALLPTAREKLAKIAGIVSTHKGLVIEADGFTDSTGTAAFNLKLSAQRAENARNYLVSQGVAADSITSKGFGVENPVASNDTKAGKQENRRVELVVTGAGITGKPADKN
ncbi:MAG: OmpA family protein [Holophaga sp.]|nr:OmpA family protein [Holophaga sp.]